MTGRPPKNLLWRAIYYIQQGNHLGSLPLVLLGFLSVLYYNLVVNVKFLSNLFPNYIFFCIVGLFVVMPFMGFLGYFHRKLSKMYSSAVEIDTESNPYTTTKIVPNAVPFWEAQIELLEQHGIDCSKIKVILFRSGSKKYLVKK